MFGKKEEIPGRGNLSTGIFQRKSYFILNDTHFDPQDFSGLMRNSEKSLVFLGRLGTFVSVRGNLTSNAKVMRKLRDTVQDIMVDLISSIFH